MLADPELRLTAKAALEHEYFTQIVRLLSSALFTRFLLWQSLTWIMLCLLGARTSRLVIR